MGSTLDNGFERWMCAGGARNGSLKDVYAPALHALKRQQRNYRQSADPTFGINLCWDPNRSVRTDARTNRCLRVPCLGRWCVGIAVMIDGGGLQLKGRLQNHGQQTRKQTPHGHHGLVWS